MKWDNELTSKVKDGVMLAWRRLVEKRKKEDGHLVISEQGKVVYLRARDIKLPVK